MSRKEPKKECLPYFVIKREQAEIAIAVAATMQYTTKIVPPELLKRREELRVKLSAMKNQHYPEDLKIQ